MSAPLISTHGLSIRYGKTLVLRNVDIAIAPNEIVTIVGPNGSGKSSLIKCLIGSLKPSSGTIQRHKGLRIGYVPQKLHIDPTFPITVRRFLSLPDKMPRDQILTTLHEVGLPDLLEQQMSGLSGGQFQRVLLARAILSRPHLLLLDEATQGLDQPGAAAFYRLIEDVRRRLGCAILMVSHDLHVVMSASDRVICLNGHVCCEGKPDIVASAPEYRALFGAGTGGALALYRHEHDHVHDPAAHAESNEVAACCDVHDDHDHHHHP